MDLRFHPEVWQELEEANVKLRATCKVHLIRLRDGHFGSIRVEKVSEKVWELKVSWNRQEYRFLYFYGGSQAVNFVHFFQKKSRKTPPAAITLATTRMKEMQLDRAIGIHGFAQ